MNCAWCSPSNNGTDGICDACMLLYFGVDAATIHAEITAEEMQKITKHDKPNTTLSRGCAHQNLSRQAFRGHTAVL
jgi:hypothetical protein